MFELSILMVGKVILALIIALVVGFIAHASLKHFLVKESDNYTRSSIEKLLAGSVSPTHEFTPVNILKEQTTVASPLGRAILGIPGFRSTYALLLKSGNGGSVGSYVILCLALFAILFWLFFTKIFASWKLGILLAALVAALVSFFLPRWLFLQRAVDKRNNMFIAQFPDALDMIVRSVRAGYPINTALKMLAENTEYPVNVEFKQVADEIAYGRTLNEALMRLSERVDVSDIRFFVVVLAVQQETGGNLAEVLSNLSSIIRKRKQMKLKIKALTSEGRATGYVLGSLPFVIFLVLYFLSPKHLDPLFETDAGHWVLITAIGLVATAALIVKKMINFDI